MLPTDSPPPSPGSPSPDPHLPGDPAAPDATDVAHTRVLKPVRFPQPGFLLACICAVSLLAIQFVIGMGLSVVASMVFVAVTGRTRDLQPFLEGQFSLVLFPVGTMTTLLVAVALAALMYRSQTSRLLGWRGLAWQQWIWVLLTVVPLAVLASEVTNCVAGLLALFEPDWLRDFFDHGGKMLERFNTQAFLLVFVVGCLLPGLGEEIFFRGVLSRGLVARYGVIAGTVMASFLFGAVHIEPVQATGACFLGVGLQLVFLATRSMLAPIVVHTLNNSLAFAVLRYGDRFPIPGLTPMPDGAIVHTPPLLILTASLTLISLAALMFQTRTRWVLPDTTYWSAGYVSAELPPLKFNARPVTPRPKAWLVGICLAAYAAMILSALIAHRGLAP